MAEKQCFVIMPFSTTASCSEGDEWTTIFRGLIKPSVESAELGYVVRRSSATTGSLIRGIVENLYLASVVIADLTDQRPNVFYELGVRHTLKNRTILIAQRLSDIPSDLTGYACVTYERETDAGQAAFAERLRQVLQELEEEADRSDNPVSDFLRARSAVIMQFEKEQNCRKLRALLWELELIAAVVSPEKKTADTKGRFWFPATHCAAIDHFLATQYLASNTLSDQASRLRALLAVCAGQHLQRSTFDTVMAWTGLLRENASRLLAAYEAGNSFDSVELTPFAPQPAAEP